jgi:hypothetical protein
MDWAPYFSMQSGCDEITFLRFLVCVMWRMAEDPHSLHVLCATRPTAQAQAPFRVSIPDKFKSAPTHTSTWNGNTSLQRRVPGVAWLYPRKSRRISQSRFLRTGRQVDLRRLVQTVHQSSLRFLSMVLYADSSSDSHLKVDDLNNADAVMSHFSDSISYKPHSGLRRMAVLLLFRYISSAWSENPPTGTHVHMQRLVLHILHHINSDYLLQSPPTSSERDDSNSGMKKC